MSRGSLHWLGEGDVEAGADAVCIAGIHDEERDSGMLKKSMEWKTVGENCCIPSKSCFTDRNSK